MKVYTKNLTFLTLGCCSLTRLLLISSLDCWWKEKVEKVEKVNGCNRIKCKMGWNAGFLDYYRRKLKSLVLVPLL